MAGIQSLMQAPGQAQQVPLPGMMPNQQGVQPGVSALVPSLSGMDIGKLLQMFNDPNSPVPKNRVLAAMDQQQKQMAAQKAVQGQVAMAQAQQQPGTVKDQVVQGALQELRGAQPTQMAAHGGMMHGYAGGGAVAFRNGGDLEEERLREKIREMFGSAASPLNILGPRAGQERQRAQDIMRMLPTLDKEQMRNILGQTQRIADAAAYQEFGPGERMEKMAPPVSAPPGRGMAAERLRAAVPSATTFDITSPGSINALRMAAQDTSLPEAERADLRRRIAMLEGQSAAPRGLPAAAAQAATPPTAGISPEMEAYFRNRASNLRTREGLPEDVLVGRAGLEALARENIEAQKSEAKTYGEEIRAARDAALARAQKGLLDDPQALLAIAGSINTRRGQGTGSLARGISGLMGEREKQAEAARKEYATAQQTERMLQANVRQATMLEAQRAQALREGDFNRANQIKDQIDALMMQRETLLMERKDKAIEQARLERATTAQEVTAAKPTELELAMARPEEYAKVMRQRAEAAQSRKSPEQIRADTLERYADNWEKLDMLQKNELAKQGVTNFQQYVRMRDQMAGLGGAPSLGAKVMTMADVQATATASGKTVDEVRKAALAAGYTIQ